LLFGKSEFRHVQCHFSRILSFYDHNLGITPSQDHAAERISSSASIGSAARSHVV
jgi:hypothetical protein